MRDLSGGVRFARAAISFSLIFNYRPKSRARLKFPSASLKIPLEPLGHFFALRHQFKRVTRRRLKKRLDGELKKGAFSRKNLRRGLRELEKGLEGKFEKRLKKGLKRGPNS